MKILLTGKNGQLGFELQRALAPLGEVVAVGTQDCNLADADALRALVRRVAPDVIVNPAAYTAVDKAESDDATAHAVNAVAPAMTAATRSTRPGWSASWAGSRPRRSRRASAKRCSGTSTTRNGCST